MKQEPSEPSDREEEARAKGISEQCWLGPICLLFWVLVILAFIHGCVKGAECSLAWDSPPAAQQVTSWRVYRGIAVVAVNGAGQSQPATLKLSFLTDQQSVDLRAWDTMRGYHREFLPGRRFYRTRIETPP